MIISIVIMQKLEKASILMASWFILAIQSYGNLAIGTVIGTQFKKRNDEMNRKR